MFSSIEGILPEASYHVTVLSFGCARPGFTFFSPEDDDEFIEDPLLEMIEAEILLPEPSSLAFNDRVPLFAEHIFQWRTHRLAWHRMKLDSRSCPVYWPGGQVRQNHLHYDCCYSFCTTLLMIVEGRRMSSRFRMPKYVIKDRYTLSDCDLNNIGSSGQSWIRIYISIFNLRYHTAGF